MRCRSGTTNTATSIDAWPASASCAMSRVSDKRTKEKSEKPTHVQKCCVQLTEARQVGCVRAPRWVVYDEIHGAKRHVARGGGATACCHSARHRCLVGAGVRVERHALRPAHAHVHIRGRRRFSVTLCPHRRLRRRGPTDNDLAQHADVLHELPDAEKLRKRDAAQVARA